MYLDLYLGYSKLNKKGTFKLRICYFIKIFVEEVL